MEDEYTNSICIHQLNPQKRKEEEEKRVVDTVLMVVTMSRQPRVLKQIGLGVGFPGMQGQIGLGRGGDEATTSSPSSSPSACRAIRMGFSNGVQERISLNLGGDETKASSPSSHHVPTDREKRPHHGGGTRGS